MNNFFLLYITMSKKHYYDEKQWETFSKNQYHKEEKWKIVQFLLLKARMMNSFKNLENISCYDKMCVF